MKRSRVEEGSRVDVQAALAVLPELEQGDQREAQLVGLVRALERQARDREAHIDESERRKVSAEAVRAEQRKCGAAVLQLNVGGTRFCTSLAACRTSCLLSGESPS